MWQLFIVLYFSYLILGPHWIVKSMRRERLDIVRSPQEFMTRAVFISYVGLLYTAWFVYKPSTSSFLNALAVTSAATVAYYVRWGPEFMHTLLNLFVLVRGKEFIDTQTFMTFLLAIFYVTFHGKIYTQ